MKPWIENVSYLKIADGRHSDPSTNSMLIQIVDVGIDFPKPKYPFAVVNRLRFGDDYNACTQRQAQKIVMWLKSAYENDMNVIVQCVAGISRSGAVVEAASTLGFEPRGLRSPNKQLLAKLMEIIES